MKQYCFACFAIMLLAISLQAQNGGKAQPKRIQFPAGVSSTTLTGTLSTGRQIDYVFAAAKGQYVTVKNPTYSRFDFRVFDEANFPEGDFDSSPAYGFEIPETGDYLLTVRKKVAGPRTSRFSITIAIK